MFNTKFNLGYHKENLTHIVIMREREFIIYIHPSGIEGG
jgi:hypothetical protein